MADVKAPLTTTPPKTGKEWVNLAIGIAVTAVVIGVIAYAAGKGWKAA